MKHLLFLSTFTFSLFFSSYLYAQGELSPRDIVRRSEEVLRGVESAQAEMKMTIVRPKWQREIGIKSWSKGDDYALILVTSPAREKGSATLKRGREVWSWMPRIERTLKMPPSMMSQSWMGSDMKNEDLVREFSLSEDYEHELLEETEIEGRSVWKIELTPKEDAAVVWGRIVMYIDQEEFLQLRGEYYDEDDFLINEMRASNVREMDGRTVTTRLEIIPVEEEGHKTIVEYIDLKFDANIPDSYFTLQHLQRLR